MKVFLVTVLITLTGCRCVYSYVSKNNTILENGLFQLECRINPYLDNELDQLEVAIYYNDSLPSKIVKSSVKVFPIVGNEKDTLTFVKEYASHFYFNFYEKWPESMSLVVNFDVDSSNIITRKSIFIKGLTISKDCSLNFVPH